jgi:hypothetical protein
MVRYWDKVRHFLSGRSRTKHIQLFVQELDHVAFLGGRSGITFNKVAGT